MLTGLYSAASGMIVQEQVQDVLAQNLAGSQMPGFRREEVIVRSFPDVMLSSTYKGLSPSLKKDRFNHAIGRVGTGAGVFWVFPNQQNGALQHTGSKTDFALFGDGFFTVMTPDGVRFTRAGDFLVDKDGYLVNSQGFQVLGQGLNNRRVPGPINVGKDDFHVDYFGQIFAERIDPQTGIKNHVLVDQLKIVDFEDRGKLFREPGNLFRVEPGDKSNITIPERYRVAQGYIEKSNSLPSTEMVKMIDSYRIHEASARVVQSLDQTLQKAVNDLGKV